MRFSINKIQPWLLNVLSCTINKPLSKIFNIHLFWFDEFILILTSRRCLKSRSLLSLYTVCWFFWVQNQQHVYTIRRGSTQFFRSKPEGRVLGETSVRVLLCAFSLAHTGWQKQTDCSIKNTAVSFFPLNFLFLCVIVKYRMFPDYVQIPQKSV